MRLLPGSTVDLARLGCTYGRVGKRTEAERVLAELTERSKQKYVAPFYFAMVWVGLGEKEKALDWLERAYQERDPGLRVIKVDPMFNSIRREPRFINILRGMGLEP